MDCNTFTSGADAQIGFSLGTVVVDPCPTTTQALAQAIINALTGTLPGNFATFNIGSDTPTPDNRNKLWYRVDEACNPLGWYLWTGAAWTSALPLGASPGTVGHYWSTALAGLTAPQVRAAISFRDTGEAYPGGGSETLHTDPFWLLCDGTAVGGFTPPNLLGRVIVGAGSGAGLTVRAPGDTGGEEGHVLSVAELPPHQHNVATGTGVGAPNLVSSGSNGSVPVTVVDAALPTGGGLAHQNMMPFNCIYPVVRTARTI